jgi:hypothetical protein
VPVEIHPYSKGNQVTVDQLIERLQAISDNGGGGDWVTNDYVADIDDVMGFALIVVTHMPEISIVTLEFDE